MNALRHLLAACLAGIAAAAAAADPPPIKSVDTLAPTPWSAADGERTIAYKKTVLVATDEPFGEVQTGLFCSGSRPLMLNTPTIQGLTSGFASTARRELRRLGFKDPAAQTSAFVPKEATDTGDYELAATVRSIQTRICTGGVRDNAGAVWMQVQWEVFSPRQQKVVLSLTTEGSIASDKKIEKTFIDYFDSAFLSALRNALSDGRLAQRLKADPSVPAAGAEPAPLASLAVARQPDAQDLPDDEFTQQRSAVTTVFSGVGSGTGFYIDASGYLLTNRHVVGDAKFVKVRLANGRDVVGEVLRSDPLRDVALVKTEAVSLRALPLSQRAAGVGDEVFVIGSPLGDRFATSLTKGVLSGTPTLEQRRYLQSDTRVLPGSSGGPLLRRDGGVIGLVAGGVGPAIGATLNLFVPIDEALSKMGLVYKP